MKSSTIFTATFFALIGMQATAECVLPAQTFLYCTFDNGQKAVSVCVDAKTATYSFGPRNGAAELTLSDTVIDADYTPWPGVSSNIYETMTFYNAGVRYAVTGVIHREYPQDENADVKTWLTGEIEVAQGDNLLATLTCDPDSIDFGYGGSIFDAKTAAGQCWDFDVLRWRACE